MSKVLIIGAGGVGNVVAKKCAMLPEVFSDIMLASRTKSKCDAIAAEITHRKIHTAAVDADNVPELVALIKSFQPKLVINVALPYQDLHIMDACLETGVHYLDTANYEPIDEAKFEYSWQWAYKERFEKAGLMALLGCGFDPGVTGVFTAHAAKHHFDEIHYLDIVDCNAGDHGKAFATNFNPEINIREITANGRYWENGKWVETKPLEIHKPIDYPNVGPKESYLLYHEELESLVKNFPTIKRARFWMTFGQEYITHLRVLQNVGMTRIDPIMYEGKEIVPLQFLKAVLPEPSSLGENYVGETSIGCQIKGIKDGKDKTYFVWNNCSHAAAWKEVQGQGVAYTTGVPAMIGAKMMLEGKWMKAGVYNVEEMNPDPFMEDLNKYGLPWHEAVNIELPHDYN
jgi:saccharopine dehydrogenase (NAD+, L-lysine forming)